MYGTAKELAENMKIFRDFPFNVNFYDSSDSLFFSSAIVYESLKGEKFISNMDILIILQNMALKIFPKSNTDFVRTAMMEPLRYKGINSLSSLKFIKFDEKMFDEIEKEIKKAAKLCVISERELVQFNKQFAEGNFSGFVRKTQPKTKAEEARTTKLAEHIYNTSAPNDPRKNCSILLPVIMVMKYLHDIIDERPNLFSGDGVPFVRVFEDGSDRFVMKAELFYAISKTKKNKFKDEDHLFTTISMEDVGRIYGHRVKDIEFIRTPIIRSKHRPSLVLGHFTGEYGFLAADHLFDFFYDFIIGRKAFQRNLNPNWKQFSDSIENWFDKDFKPECKTPYFIQCELSLPHHFDFDESLRPKDIRNAKIDGFTVQNLKNELVHLGLNRVFPEIGDHAETVYSAVDEIKKGQYLRTCDLFDAVFYCQLICLLDKVPKFKRFLHNQSGCGRVLGYNCEMCQKKKSEIQKSLELSSNESKGIESSENMKKEDTKMISFEEYEEMKMKILELEKENRELKEDKSRSSIQIDNLNLDKLSIDSSIPTVSTNNIISECLICKLELKTTGDTLKCPICRTRFHSKCAMEYAKYGVQCPSCKGTLQNSMAPSKLF